MSGTDNGCECEPWVGPAVHHSSAGGQRPRPLPSASPSSSGEDRTGEVIGTLSDTWLKSVSHPLYDSLFTDKNQY